MNVGMQNKKTFEEEANLLKQNIVKRMEEMYNKYINNIQRGNNENQLLSELSTIYQEFLYNIDKLIKEFNVKDSIEKHKVEIKIKARELYSKYYLQLQELKSKDNFNQKKETLPTFEELKKLKDKYEIKNTEYFGHLIVIEKETGKQVTDSKIINDVNFAYLWRYAARIKVFSNDDEGYAFNNLTEESYKFFVNEIMEQIKETGTIDSIKLFRKAQIHSLDYKYTTEIITKLFDTKSTIKKIENILRDREIVTNNALENTQELYGDELIATRISQEQNNEVLLGNRVIK